MSSPVPSARDDNAPYGAITKSLRSGTLLAPKEYPEKCRCSACSGPTRLAGRPGRRGRFSLACSSLRPSERIKHCVRLHGLTSAASRPPPPMGGRGEVLCLRRGQTLCLWRGCLKRAVTLLLRKGWDTVFDCRLSSQVPSSKDENAPYGAITKNMRSGTLLAPKEYPEKCRCPHAADPGASQGAPAGAAVSPWRLRRSVLANA